MRSKPAITVVAAILLHVDSETLDLNLLSSARLRHITASSNESKKKKTPVYATDRSLLAWTSDYVLSCIMHASSGARKILEKPQEKRKAKVLLDTSVLRQAELGRVAASKVSGLPNKFAFLETKARRKDENPWLQAEIELLPTVSRLASNKLILLFESIELMGERWRGNSAFGSSGSLRLFNGVKIHEVKPPLDRARLFSGFDHHWSKDAVAMFLDWLVNLEANEIEELKPKLTAWELCSLRSFFNFSILGSKYMTNQREDLFHLWTGHINAIPYFLTLDRKLINVVESHKAWPFSCRPIFPSSLLKVLDVTETVPMPFDYGTRYTIAGRKL